MAAGPALSEEPAKMKPLTLFCWLGCLALVTSSTYGQGSVMHRMTYESAL